MLKVIGGAVAGYAVIFALVFGLMTAAWFAVGAEGAFRPSVWDATATWLFLMLGAALVSAAVGGYVTAMLTSDPRAPKLLAGIVVVLGVVFALPVLMGSGPTAPLPRPAAVPMLEAMQNGKQPGWVALLNPVLGAAGVLFGARLRSRRTT